VICHVGNIPLWLLDILLDKKLGLTHSNHVNKNMCDCKTDPIVFVNRNCATLAPLYIFLADVTVAFNVSLVFTPLRLPDNQKKGTRVEPR